MTVHQLILGDAGKLSSELTHVLTGHTRDALCVDTQADLVVSGGLDTTVLVYRLGPENLFKVVHKLTGHTLKVRDITPETSSSLLISPRCGVWHSMVTMSYLGAGTGPPGCGASPLAPVSGP